MRISVVIPCYNAARWVANALHSVAGQTCPPHEIIVVDDGSTDDSVRVIESCGVPVRLMHTERVNAAAARNVAIDAAKGDWIAFLDADDRWYPFHLERATRLLNGGHDVAYLSLMDLVDEQDRLTEARNPWPIAEPTAGLTHQQCIDFWQIKRNFYSLITIVASRARLQEVGGFDTTQKKAHDVELWLRLIHGRTWAYDPVATALHATQRPGGITQSGRAESQYFLMRGFLNNRDRYRDTPAFENILQHTARETISSALRQGNRDDQRRICDIAWQFLRPADRFVFSTLGRLPVLYRALHGGRMKLKSLFFGKRPSSRARMEEHPSRDSVAVPSELFDATVVIVTKNRKEELRQAIASAVEQEGRVEVLVIDDGSTDGTSQMICDEFPTVRLERVEQSQGYIVHRNRAANLAASPVIFSLDDDAAFSSPLVVQETLAEFSHPRVGAVAIPSIDINRPGRPLYRPAPPDDSIWATDTYRGTSHALRRELFLALHGYRESFFHQSEEGEFCLRLLNLGYITRVGASSPIHHFESPKRDRTRIFTYNARNRILFAWYNVPWPELVVQLPGSIIRVLLYGLKSGYLFASLRGVAFGLGMILKEFGQRKPVNRRVFRLSRQLRHQGPEKLSKIESALPQTRP